MSESPKKKRPKLDENEAHTNDLKRPLENDPSPSKRIRGDDMPREESQEKKLQAMRRKNFITACQRVSYQAYFDHTSRFQLVYIPSCLRGPCNHHHDNKSGTLASQMPSYAEESFKIEVKANMWHEALEVCTMCISPKQYLSANVLKDVVEIIMNAHDDTDGTYSTADLIEQCQQILGQNFSTHPPCLFKSIRECYKTFLTSPLDPKDKTFTNRTEFGCDKGIVKYCMNRLQYELSSESKDEPLVDKYSKIPLDMKQSVKGLHWQKEKFEIFELLTRSERIERLMVVLESLIELLQFDLAIWHSRHSSNQSRHIMRSHKPLMAHILWTDNVLYTGAVNSSCRQILRLFVQFVHLGYPVKDTNIMRNWLNTIIQTFYICETNSNGDYPNVGKYCMAFAKEFYKIIAELPNAGIIKVLEAIQPTYMTHLVALLHLKDILDTKEDDILRIIIEYIKKSRWKEFPESPTELKVTVLSSMRKRKNIKKKLKYLVKKCREFNDQVLMSSEVTYPKEECMVVKETKFNQNHVIHIMFIVLQAYLDANSVQHVQEKLESLNDRLHNNVHPHPDQQDEAIFDGGYYSVTEHFIKKYRTIYQTLQELMLLFEDMKSKGQLPELVKVFENVGLLEL